MGSLDIFIGQPATKMAEHVFISAYFFGGIVKLQNARLFSA
jgi:hypothetical protein